MDFAGMAEIKTVPVAAHWGNYLVDVDVDKDAIINVRYPGYDPNPSPIGRSLKDARHPDCRIPQPMVRAGYLDNPTWHDRTKRGKEAFVPITWDEALDLAADALKSVIAEYGNESIYGGSYGWASAGRFHHALSHIHRFLKLAGGYTASIYTYSAAACEAIMPHLLGVDLYTISLEGPVWDEIVENKSLVVAIGGMRIENTQVNVGGVGAHFDRHWQKKAHDNGVEIVNISPIRDDVDNSIGSEWISIIPNTDTALMLAVAYVLVDENLHDKSFLDKYCAGFEKFLPYLTGSSDGTPKTPEWASGITGVPAEQIRSLARRMAANRTAILLTFAIQRAEHGEQPYWMATVLAAMLGQYGLPGGGISPGHATAHVIGYAGRRLPPFRWGRVEQGGNPVKNYIPVSRIADMLLNPGLEYDFDGKRLTYPDIRLVYWAGGNPFHHHQDLNRLRRAFTRPDTIIVNESVWSGTARHADIVFPVTTMVERDDIVCGYDQFLTPSRQAVNPYAQARSDYRVFSGLAGRMGLFDQYTEGRSEFEWIRHLYETSVSRAAKTGIDLPDFDSFWASEGIDLTELLPEHESMFEAFRRDPVSNRLGTPSGKIEIFSEEISGFGYDDCPGHPVWLDKDEWLGSPLAEKYPLHLISNQPTSRLHSQFDFGINSTENKIQGREPMRMHPADAAARNIGEGEVVRVFNDRGACLAGVRLSKELRRGVVQLSTGAWYEPPADEELPENHGNPNVLTRDKASSKLSQALTAHSCLVDVEKYTAPLPEVKAHKPPEILWNL